MERNDSTNDIGTNAGRSAAADTSAPAAAQPASTQSSESTFDFHGAEAGEQSHNLRDRARQIGGSVRERAGSAKDRLADVLESGAGRLRERAHADGNTPGAAASGTTSGIASSASSDGAGRMSQVSEKVAGGMQASAEWLRDADMDSLRTSVERQAREHPGRTLLIAAGLGYLIGRAFKGNQST